MKKVFSFLFLVTFSFTAWSWSERGNSGFSIICEDSNSNKFFDAYEAEFRYGLLPVYPEMNEACSSDAECLEVAVNMAREIFKRLPLEAKKNFKNFINTRLDQFSKEASILNEIEILPVNDIGIGFIPKHCSLHQTIVQRVPLVKHDKRYIISNEYWGQLSLKQKAVGVVHEVLYSFYAYLQQEPVSSEKIRYFNSLLLSNEISNFTPAEYRELFNRTYFGD